MAEKKYHRVRFYEGRWSTFDSIKECSRPGPCWGCEFKHPLCTELGAVTQAPGQAKEEFP
jgi:hypothetical protein